MCMAPPDTLNRASGQAPDYCPTHAPPGDRPRRLGPSIASRLSQRELEIVSYVARGLSNRAIGDTLGLSENTVRNHLRSILEKLEFDNRVQVATFALKHGIGRRSEPSS